MLSLFKNIKNEEQLSERNLLFEKISVETQNISKYLNESINEFPKLFNENYTTLNDSLDYLKNIALPNKYVCAHYIKEIPGWTCKECSKYTDSIICHDCIKQSKEIHKNHHLYFLPYSGGMCGCGEPEGLYNFCPEHSGPHINQNQINEYISKIFEKNILDKLKTFFNIFFQKFSYYFILTEKCQYFCPEIFEKTFNNNDFNNFDSNFNKQKIYLLKNNFCKVYQNFLDFLRLITENNLGMLYLIANYFLKNHFENNVDKELFTNHRCVKFDIENIEILYEKNEEEGHNCQCPFFTIFLSNWRDNINRNDYENQKFLLSFTRNFPLKHGFGVVYFCINKQIYLNGNLNLISNRIQFILDYTTAILAEKTTIIEETYELFYDYFSKNIKSLTAKNDNGTIKQDVLENLFSRTQDMEIDCELYSMPITRKLMANKISLIKRIIDCLCLIHNENEFISIWPHPPFQQKGFSEELINLESKLLGLIECINMFTDWKNIENIKDIFKYLIYKITNQESEGIKQLKEKEYSFHLCLYRCFGLLINFFCFYNSFNNKCSLFSSIQFFIKIIFESENQSEKLINIILHDYYKFFSFISGIKNGFFNYYDSMVIYTRLYCLDQKILKIDFTLLKYLLIMSTKNINIDDYLKISNIENSYSFLKELFLDNKIKNNLNYTNNNNISSDDLLNILNNSYNIFPQAIDYGENLEILRNLQEQYETQINSNTIQQYINNLNANKEKLIDNFNNIMYIKFLLELLIILIKDDSSPYYNLMRFFKCTSSTETKSELFDEVKANKYAMKDLENILKEKLVQEFASKGNLSHLEDIKENIDKYLFDVFDEKYLNDILDELTLNKITKNQQFFYLKNESFKYLDMSYYYSFIDKSKAQRYIIDFKKDYVKSYNTYFFKPSYLTFEFFEKIYEKILLNKSNLEIIIKIIERLMINKQDSKEIIINSIKNSFLDVIFKYLSIFGCINTKSFIEFKLKNEDLINEINQILNNAILYQDKTKLLDNDFEENVKEVIKQLNHYKIIYKHINNDFSKLNNYQYNSECIEESNKSNNISNNKNNLNKNYHKKMNNIKNNLKNKMKNKNKNFFDNIQSNKEMFNEINNQIQSDINENKENETMCFFCRNKIQLDSFEVPYGKGGYYLEDFFYRNSLNSSIKSELLKLTKDKNEEFLNDDINKNKTIHNLSKKIISCGHYFHFSCFKKKNRNYFSCPLCLKKQNILIPPLIIFHDKYSFLKPYKLEQLFNNEDIKEDIIEEQYNSFVNILNEFLSVHFSSSINIKYIDQIIPIFRSYFNYLENILYYDGTYFHKKQQIEIHKNIILVLRYMTKGEIIDKNDIITIINQDLLSLIIGPKENENIINNYEKMRYAHMLEKLLLYLSILFDYDEIKQLFPSIIYIFLPYLSFGFYLRELIVQNKFYSFYEENMKEKINVNNLMQYFEDNNLQMNNCFKLLLQKITIIKLITDYKDNNDNIINSFNELNIENLLSILNMDNMNNLLHNNEINEIKFINIFDILSKTINLKEVFRGKLDNDFNYNQIFNMLINNIKNIKNEKYIINKELLIQFSPIKFEFISLDKNIFDFIEKYLEEKCVKCSKKSRFYYICLICGDKICKTKSCNQHFNHALTCGGRYCILIDMNNTKISISESNSNIKEFSSLYINKEGLGPKSKKIGKEFNLSKAKEKIFFRDFICYDFHFN